MQLPRALKVLMTLPEFFTLPALRYAYATGASAHAVIRECYRRIRAVNDPGIFISLLPEDAALQAAARLGDFDPDGKPLWGVPFAVKDNIDVALLPTTAACPAFAYTPTASAFAVEQLLTAGAICLGKTNLDQFATGLVGVRTPYPIPINPFDRAYVPGGSSSGSAVAVAHALVSFAVGTDTAGSGRVPAALNNIVGLKPSLGSVSVRGLVPACRTLDTLSVFAGTVDDAYRVYQVMTAYDAVDPWSRPSSQSPIAYGLPPALRIGVPDGPSRNFGGDTLARSAFDASLDDLTVLAGTGIVRELDLTPFFEVAQLLYHGPWLAERYQAVRTLLETSPQQLHPTTLQVISAGGSIRASDAFAGFYTLAALRRVCEEIWKHIDLLVVPTYPRPRTLADLEADPIGPNSELGTYTNFVNLLDLCALAVPSRFRPDGLPSGVTLIAPRGRDGQLAACGARLHAAAGLTIGRTAHPVPAAPAAPATAAADEIELAVVGAHLSGMPLNHELTGRGARFVRAVTTASEYRLFSLPGGPPRRPGLLRVPTTQGAAIATEVWALSFEAFASFVAAIPAPLGIGTVRLADGTQPKGFIVESEGLRDATDVSQFGGWRAYIASLSAR